MHTYSVPKALERGHHQDHGSRPGIRAPSLTIQKDEIDFALKVIEERITEEETVLGLSTRHTRNALRQEPLTPAAARVYNYLKDRSLVMVLPG